MLTGLDEITQKLKDLLAEKESGLLKNIEGGNFINFEKELKTLTDNFAKDLTESLLNEVLDTPKMKRGRRKSRGSRNV